MQVQVKNRLSRCRTIVDRDPKGIFDLELTGDLAYRQHQVSQESLVGGGGLCKHCNRLLRNQEYMEWRLRINVLDREAQVVLVDDVGRNLFIDNSSEE